MIYKFLYSISIACTFYMSIANAYVINFDEREFCGAMARDMSHPVIEGEYKATGIYQSYFSLSNPGSCTSHVLFPDNGTTFVRIARDSLMYVSRLDKIGFNLISLDYAEYSEKAITDSTEIIGYKKDGSIVSTLLFFDKIFDGFGGKSDFQKYYFDSSWRDLDYVEFSSPLTSIDNIEVYKVPEPDILVLMLIGLIYIFNKQGE